MADTLIGARPDYGAWELKRVYQRHMLLATMLAVAVYAGAFAGMLLYRYLAFDKGAATAPHDPGTITVDMFPTPTMVHRTPVLASAPQAALPTIGIPVPAPDEQVTEAVRFPTQAELAELSMGDLPAGMNDGAIVLDSVAVNLGDYIPEPGEFVAVEELPRLVHAEPAIFPEMARLTGREGSVTVLALVGIDGAVRRVQIAKSSGTSVGFDEAAVAAVSRYRFRPAIQNGRPVNVWVSQRIDFKLH